MIRFSVSGVEFRLHALVIILAGLAFFLDMGQEMPFVLMALGMHEAAHIAAARACGLEIEYIEIMPFGGAAHVRELYSAPGGALAIVALAGPLANGILMLAAGAMGWWRVIGFDTAGMMVRINGMLMAFNMIPALPLDGGRVLYGAIKGFIGRRRAANIGAGIAYVLAAGLAAGAAVLFLKGGKVNVSLIIMAVFLVASAWSERNGVLEDGAAMAVRSMCRARDLPGRARVIALDAGEPISRAARFMGGREMVIFAMMRDGRIMELIGEGDAAERMMKG